MTPPRDPDWTRIGSVGMTLAACALGCALIFDQITGRDSQTFLTVAAATFGVSCMIQLLGYGDERQQTRPTQSRPVVELLMSSALAVGSLVFLVRGVAVSARFAFIASVIAGLVGAGSSLRRMRDQKQTLAAGENSPP